MIVPQYWAEGRVQSRAGNRQITVRRFGWSDTSAQDAQRMADQRAAEALVRIANGEKLARRDPKVPYNGAEGVPIREEILGRHGESVITRNAYGARCLNTPNVLFADIDLEEATAGLSPVVAFLALSAAGGVWWWHSVMAGIAAGFLVLVVGSLIRSAFKKVAGSTDRRAENARTQIQSFLHAHPDWRLRLYRTPAGFRLLAMHRTFDALDPAVTECFKTLGVDAQYARMCANQRCFRARVTAKPWRIGITSHLRPRPGVWPIHPDRLPERSRWVEDYEEKARGYSACRFEGELGGGGLDPSAQAVQVLHDELCRSASELPLA